ncbi:MAG: YabP/YqfC family sporulation protein [Clostridia bacterium]|nr:YabP/YqfC family sporulation protein [Clostridia bacterium]
MAKRKRNEVRIHRGDPAIVTVHNANNLIVEGVERIVFCDSEKMILKNLYMLEIEGENLSLHQLGNDNVAVRGIIFSIRFSQEKQ